MKLTPEQLRPEQLRQNAAAMIAHLEGKPVQVLDTMWSESTWVDDHNPGWHCPRFIYRPKPEPVRCPWSSKDVPPVCWLKIKTKLQDEFITAVLTVGETGVRFIGDEGEVVFVTYHQLSIANSQHSTDLKTWAKCEVEE